MTRLIPALTLVLFFSACGDRDRSPVSVDSGIMHDSGADAGNDSGTEADVGTAVEHTWDREGATSFLAGRSDSWLRERSCTINCHTTVPLILSMPAHAGGADSAREAVLSNVQARVRTWNSVEPWYNESYGAGKTRESFDTEAVLNAMVLVLSEPKGAAPTADAAEALRIMWERGAADSSGWRWLNFGLQPWEVSEARTVGLAYTGLTVAHLGEDYLSSTAEPAQTMIPLLRTALLELRTSNLHDQLLLLWVASEWPGLLSPDEIGAITTSALAAQRADGGWNLTDYGFTAQPAYPATSSTPYATGLAVVALLGSGTPQASDEMVRACDYLIGAQVADGSFSDRSLNKDMEFNHGLISDAATAFSLLALDAATR